MSVYHFSNNNTLVSNITNTLPEDLNPGDIIFVYATMQDGQQDAFGIIQWKTTEFSLQQGVYLLQCMGGTFGGYSEGVLTLNERTVIYADVGQHEQHAARSFPDGGAGATPGNGGFGSTCIKLRHDSPYARVIVAGGAGGNVSGNIKAYKMCHGGGLVSGHHESIPETGQTYGYSFGTYAQDANPSQLCGGGGGWYTGYAGNGDGVFASGGSGYVYTEKTKKDYPPGCLLTDNDFLTCAYTVKNTSLTHFLSGQIKITFLRDTSGSGKKDVLRINSNIYKNTDEAAVADISKLPGGGGPGVDSYTEQEMHDMIDTIWNSYNK